VAGSSKSTGVLPLQESSCCGSPVRGNATNRERHQSLSPAQTVHRAPEVDRQNFPSPPSAFARAPCPNPAPGSAGRHGSSEPCSTHRGATWRYTACAQLRAE